MEVTGEFRKVKVIKGDSDKITSVVIKRGLTNIFADSLRVGVVVSGEFDGRWNVFVT